MLAGIQEILSIGLIIVCIIFLPRLFGTNASKRSSKRKKSSNSVGSISGKLRLAIVFSLLLPAGAALILKPWAGQWLIFIAVGILPVVMGWAGAWVWRGFKK